MWKISIGILVHDFNYLNMCFMTRHCACLEMDHPFCENLWKLPQKNPHTSLLKGVLEMIPVLLSPVAGNNSFPILSCFSWVNFGFEFT